MTLSELKHDLWIIMKNLYESAPVSEIESARIDEICQNLRKLSSEQKLPS